MRRTSDVLSIALAVALVVLGAAEIKPVVTSFTAAKGSLAPALGLKTATHEEPPFGGAQRIAILLIGADLRPRDVGRSDTLLMLWLNPKTRHMALLGIPRDLRVEIPGRGHDKINHAYAFGGPQLARKTVERFLGRDIDFHAVVFFAGFETAVDALGGVWLEVPDVEGAGRGMNYDDNAGNLHIHLRPGYQHLDGRGALGFVRYRKSNARGLGDGDEGRSGRQQQFLREMADQHLKAASLPGLIAASRIIARNVETDMSPADVAELIGVLHGSDPAAMMTATVPLQESNWHPGETYYAYADTVKLRETLSQIDWHLQTGGGNQPTVEALNASGISGHATDAGERLARHGFKLVSCGNADRYSSEPTVIEYQQGYQEEAQLAASILGCGQPREASADPRSNSGSGARRPDIRVYVGADYGPARSS
jgi:LCP family protein required for cell wall assembly